ncbi:hypothetical protein SK128_017473 [Halocaridina rubra]|uniref:Uncharacterized protein n=1 Tax=Halocaridina rubra TaxID=373956 RepID=A0AAN8XMR1_HALRR
MVLRDKAPPRLCFDNPEHNVSGILVKAKPSPAKRPKTAEVDIRNSPLLRHIKPLVETRSMADEFLARSSSCKSNHSKHSMLLTPTLSSFTEEDVEERIVQYRRNSVFWSGNSIQRNKVLGTKPKCESPLARTFPVPSSDGKAVEIEGSVLDTPEGDEEALEAWDCSDQCRSEMTLEILKERRLRENICWIRNFICESSMENNGNFTLSEYLTTLKNEAVLLT